MFRQWFCILLVSYLWINTNLAWAAVINKSSNLALENKVPAVAESVSDIGVAPIKMNNLDSADTDTNDLIKLKRKLDIEKAQADIKKLHNSSATGSRSLYVEADKAQTIVTGVAINQIGKKIAWLQFADGGSLTVNIGSKVGKYTVSDITMNGVLLSYYSGKGHNKVESMFLNRAYGAPEKFKNQQENVPLFTPSPIVTNANNNSEDMVPPIITVR
ncbi:MAG: hypothetical protein KBD37_03080 [Burkholderiales bacterium]|nr:hypothetical protein [Burkholderiales bacterium]